MLSILHFSSGQEGLSGSYSAIFYFLSVASRNFEIKFALILAVRKTQSKYTFRYLAKKFAISLLNSLFS